MFDLEQAIATWRRRLARSRAFVPDDIEELEAHLRDHLDRLRAAGCPDAEAFRKAVRRLGDPAEVAAEYGKVRWRKLQRRGALPGAVRGELAMLGSYAKVALRHVLRQKGYAAINVLGLAIGLACCLLLLLFVRSELAVDTLYPDVERIYRVDSAWREAAMGLPVTTLAPVGQTLVREYPEVERQVRLYHMSGVVGVAEERYRRDVIMADPALFTLFGLPLAQGDPATALVRPRSMVVSEALAHTLFGSADVLGRTVLLQTWNNGDQPFTITGVLGALPYNTLTHAWADDPPYDLFIGPEPFGDFMPEEGWTGWDSRYIQQFVKLAPGADAEALQAKLDGFVEAFAPEAYHGSLALRLNPLRTLYLSENDGQGWRVVALLTAVAALILLLAGINFMNLSTARSLTRAREIGVRKTMGAHRLQLVRQFLGESVLVCAVGMLLGAAGAALALDPFFALAGKDMVLAQPWDGVTLLALLGLTLGAGLLAGAYPALFLSGFKPARALRGVLQLGPATARLRRGLVVAQFAIAVVLLISVGTISSQLTFLLQKDLGFDQENVVVIRSLPRAFDAAGLARVETVRDRLRDVPGVQAASLSWDVPGGGDLAGNSRAFQRSGQAVDDALSMTYFVVDDAFLETYGVPLEAGRFFSPARPADAAGIVLNASAAQALGWGEEAVGQTLIVEGTERPVIGVVADHHFQSLRQPVRPQAFFSVAAEGLYRLVSLRLAPGDVAGTLAEVKGVWEELLPGAPLEYTFLDDQIAQAYRAEEQVRQVIGIATTLAFLIACLGMLGLASLSVAQRTKEIGVRKVLGASVGGLVLLLSRAFLKPVLLALLLAVPIAYVLMRHWLQAFAYRVELGPGLFVLAGVLALGAAWLAVSFHTFRAARANPVQTLRYE